MKGEYGNYHRVKRDSVKGPEQSTTVSVVYVTASPSITGPIVEFMTSGPAVGSNSESAVATTSDMVNSVLSQTNTSSLSTTLPSSVAEQNTSMSSVTSTSISTSTASASIFSMSTSTSPISSSIVSSTTPLSSATTSTETSLSEQSVDSTTSLSAVLTTMKPIAMAMATPSPLSDTATATLLKDLPLVIESPISTAPKSMSLLVATSTSSENALLAPTSTDQPIMAAPHPPIISSVNGESGPKVSSSMGATGKASLIIGIVLLLGAFCMMLQVYLNKRRRTKMGEKLGDDEKGKLGFSNSPIFPTVPPKSNLQTGNLEKPSPSNVKKTTITDCQKLPSPSASPIANPFGKHAEILVDSVNASGPTLNERVSSNTECPPSGGLAHEKSTKRHSLEPNDPTSSNKTIGSRNESELPAMTTGVAKNLTTSSQAPSGVSSPINAVYRAQIDFTPSMDDELELKAGQFIRVLHEYDDGWAMCVRLDCAKQGVCPRTCLSTRPVMPRSPSGGSRGPPPAMNVPMTPSSRPQPHTRISGSNSPAVSHFATNTPRSPRMFESASASSHRPLKLPIKQDSSIPAQQSQRESNPADDRKVEIPLPLIVFPEGAAENNSTPETTLEKLSPINITLPSETSSATVSKNSGPYSPIAGSVPECPGPMAPAHDYFSLNKPIPPCPAHTDSTPEISESPEISLSHDLNVIPSNLNDGTNSQALYHADYTNDIPVPGQAL